MNSDHFVQIVVKGNTASCSCGFELDMVTDVDPPNTIRQHAGAKHEGQMLVYHYEH